MIPTSGKAEVHVGYECDLACRNCNRMSFLREAHTPAMTPADLIEFLNQARALEWYPAILLIGGEPTLHSEFFRFCELAAEFVQEGRARGAPDLYFQLWSNHFSEQARERCDEARRLYGASVVEETAKARSMILSIDDIYVSPLDMGLGVRPPCWQHASQICGISVDSAGYTPCAIGGAVDAILGIGFRTKRLADLFDADKAAEITAAMCGHCGHDAINSGLPGCSPVEWREKVDTMPRWHGMRVSPTWEAAFAGRR